jgi:eukaryotic-like serine/threonine-protein kinase
LNCAITAPVCYFSAMGTGRVIFISALTAAIVSAATFFGLRTWFAGGAGPGSAAPTVMEEVEVPPLSGLRPDQARKLLEPRALLLVISEQREDPRIESGQIVQQTPLEGSRVKRGAEIRVTLSSGTPGATSVKVEVPTLARLPLATATQMLTGAGLKLGLVTRAAASGVPPDQVISSSPAAGERVPRDSAVALTVAGPAAAVAVGDEVKVPSVIGKMVKQGTAEIVAAGLKLGKVTYGFDEDRRGGVIIKQTPAPESKAAKGSAVNLVVNESD